MSSTYDIEWTKQLRERDNVEQTSVTIGTIIQVNPILISIYGGKTILNNKLYYLCSYMSTINLIKGDKVLCIPTPTLSTFFIVDKVVI